MFAHPAVTALLVGLSVVGSVGTAWSLADPPEGQVPGPKQAIEPIAPAVPAPILASLQEGKFQEALKALNALPEEPDADAQAFLNLVKGVALRLDGRFDTARQTLQAAIDQHPQGAWVAKLRSELARTELAASRPAPAEALARAEVEALLRTDRKDRLAEVYVAAAEMLLKPADPNAQPDPNGAHDLLAQAQSLAKGDSARARVLFRMGRASQQAGDHGRALQEFQTYLGEFPQGVERSAVRFHLGEAQLAANQAIPARATWTDLARDLEKLDDKELADLRARALYAIPSTYGIPRPGNDTHLNLGVAALKRALEAYPGHPQAVIAAYRIGESYLARGKTQEAVESFNAFLRGDGYRAESEEARRDLAERLMSAQFQLGKVLQSQAKFDEAIAAFRGYLTKHPDGPQSADSQRAILDTQLLAAQAHRRAERFDQARETWRTFVTDNPLDGRVPQVLYDIGESLLAQKRFDDATAAWETLIGKFPQTEPAAHGQFQIAFILETEKGDPATAIERYKRITLDPWKQRATQRIAVMEAKALTVVTPRAYRSGELARLKVTTRNLAKLTFSAYRLNPETYFRKKQQIGGIESLDIGLVAADHEWSLDVPGYAKYKPIEREYDLKPLNLPGVYVVKVTDETSLQASTLVIGSDLDAIVKVSKDQLLVFAQDMKTGQGRAGARVLIATPPGSGSGSGIALEANTGPDGVLLQNWDKPRDPNAPLTYMVLDGEHVAGSGLSVPGTVAQGLSPRAYLYTDRPAYRPGQTVELRGVVREVQDGQYAAKSGAAYKLEVFDSRGRQILGQEIRLSDFGTFHQRFAVDSGAPVGTYRVRVHQPGGSDFSGEFQVQAYQLQKVDLAIELPRSVYLRGETIEAKVIARYQYGSPVAGQPIQVRLPDGRILSGTTDQAGSFPINFETEGFAEEQALRIVAALPQENVGAVATAYLAVRAFRMSLNTDRSVYLAGETVPARLQTSDVEGKPIGQDVSLALLKRIPQPGGTVAEREVVRRTVRTDAKTGEATVPLTIEDEEGGPFVIRATGSDRFGNPVVAERVLTISGAQDKVKLRLLADRIRFKVGEPARVNLHNRSGAGTALLTWEADRVLSYKILTLKDGDNPVSWEADGAQFPNFRLSAARMADTSFHQAQLDLIVERDLNVTITPKAPRVGPGEEVEVEVTTRDQLGRPVAAEVSLALVDRALLRQYQDTLPPIGVFFHGQTRLGAFQTEATITFRYQPPTVPVASALVEDRARREAAARDQIEANVVREQLGRQIAQAPAAPPPPPGPSGGMGGGYGYGTFGGVRAADMPQSAGRPEAFFGQQAQVGETLSRLDEKKQAEDLGLPAEGMFEGAIPEVDAPGALQAGARRSRVGRGEAAGKAMAGAELSVRKAGQGPVQARQQFVETAYWNPAVVTGADGTARVMFTAPTALSEYRFTARGVTGADTLVGQTTANLSIQRDFFVELKLPAGLTQGDRPRFTARLHHLGVRGRAEVRLAVYAGGAERVMPRTVDLQGDGVEELLFDPWEISQPDDLRLELTARCGESSDQVIAELPVRPWGRQAFATASGSASNDATVFVGLPPGRTYDSPEMLVTIAPTVRRMLIELALGRHVSPVESRVDRILFPPGSVTVADRASELLAAASVLASLRDNRGSDAPEVERLSSRIRGLVAELVTTQNEDGGWPWVSGMAVGTRQEPRASDRLTSARAAWALARVEPLGLLPEPGVLDRATNYLEREFARIEGSDLDTRSAVLHALSTRRKATFEQANALNRSRQNLSDVSLAHLALTLVNLSRTSLADEVLGVLAPRAKTEAAGPGFPNRIYWEGKGTHPCYQGPAEATALAALAFAQVRPQAQELAGAVSWLMAHRAGAGWSPHKAIGPALAALAAYHGQTREAGDRYRLVIKVNDAEVGTVEVTGSTQSQVIRVPRRLLQTASANKVTFDVEGRGTFGYAVTLTGFTREFGPDQNRANRSFLLDRRAYLAAEPELDGKPLPTGFGVAVNPTTFENTVSQLPLGGKARIVIDAHRVIPAGKPAWEREFLVLEEHLPAGATLIEGSVRTDATHYEVGDRTLTFYFAPDQWPGRTQYDVFGFLPGDYRALPPELRNAYDPGKVHLGPEGALKVLSPGETSTDPYRPTPDELYARGKTLFDAGELAQAGGPLEELFAGYTLRDEVVKDTVRMLLFIHIEDDDANKIVRDFEVLKEKSPELVIPFDKILVVGRAYRDIGEHERAYLVWRATAEASYLEDARVGEVLRQRGQTLEGIAYLLNLWREYPDSASIESDFFGLSQVLASLAGKAITDPDTRKALANAEATRADLLFQSIRLVRAFLTLAPRNPLADEASLAVLGAALELEDFETVVRLARQYAEIYPQSKFLDSFQYSEALGRFHLGQYDRAIEVAGKIAAATYKDKDGVDQPSPNKWEALYILGQIHDARRQPARAIDYYREVEDRFSEAALAIQALTREELKLPEVTVLRPAPGPDVAAGDREQRPRGLRAIPPADPEPVGVQLDYRNIAEADIKVYRVDLMQLYLTRRNLDAIAGIDLAGISPLVETTVKLGDGQDYDDKSRRLPLPIDKEGAYLVMVRGDDRYASGIVLMSPLELEVLEDAGAGRVRVVVRDARTKDPVPKVQIKVIGSDNSDFLSDETDLRGASLLEGVRGQATVVARQGTQRYAFYRGTTYLGAAPTPALAAPSAEPAVPQLDESLDKNIRGLNLQNQMRQLERLEQRYKEAPSQGVQVEQAK
jgi:hypothetical protein